MRYDLLIRGARVVTPDGVAALTVAVSDGSIAALAPELEGGGAEEVDARGLFLLPAAIDAHVHFNEPGREDWEGIATGSAAVAAGGGACFLDMPLNSTPPTVDAAAFDRKREAAERASVTDFGLWGGLVPGGVGEMEALAERGVVGFKAFMSGSGIPDFDRADDLTLLEGMAEAARLGLPVAVHAESESITGALAARAVAAGHVTARDYLASRPVVAEVEAIRRAVTLAEETGCSLHVVHVSSGQGVLAVLQARERGVDVTCETCPHYLLLDEDDVERIGALAKCAPPLRPRPEVESLWAHLARGDIQLVASDHSPAPMSMKGGDDFFQLWGGIAGCQSTLSALLVEGHLERGMALERVAALTAAGPAERFRLAGKGRIEVGADADLVLVELEAAAPLREEHLFYRHRVSPFLGLPLHGLVKRTVVRGVTVFADGRLTGARSGRLVRPAARKGVPR